MDFLLEHLKTTEKYEIITIYNNLKSNNLQIENFYENFDSIFKSNTKYIYNIINIYTNLKNFKKKSILRNIVYLNKKILKSNISNNFSSKYKLSNNNDVRKFIFLFLIILYHSQVFIQNDKKISPELKYNTVKKIYFLLYIFSTLVTKFYYDQIININDFEILLKIYILFSINNYNKFDIREKNNLKNIMYLKECLKIIKIICDNDINEEQKNLIIKIFKYINNNICYSDKDNNNLNYTNKFYMINNDNNTTKLLNLMKSIHKINNKELTEVYFELLSNIYYFQFNYDNLNRPLYKLLEPLLVNIDKKDYSSLLNEISFPNFQLNFIKYLIDKEKSFTEKNGCILKNGFYFGENNNNGIIAEMDAIKDNFILTFGFKLVVNNKISEIDEYILLQFKNIIKNKCILKILIEKNTYNLIIIIDDSYDKKKTLIPIIPNKYYILSIEKKKKSLNIIMRYDCDGVIMFDIKNININFDNSILCVGCDIEEYNNDNNKNKSIKSNFIYKNKFTGFFGDILIINTKLLNEKKNNDYYLQNKIVNLQGRYGNTIIKSIYKQKYLDEYIISDIGESIKNINKGEKQDEFEGFFNILSIENNNDFIIIDNTPLFISSKNFILIDYLDNIDYLNFDNCYSKKEKLLNQTKKEYQFVNNYKIKRNKFLNKIVKINTNLFNCNFNIFENKNCLLKLVEGDGIFYLILIFEYYYQILYKIYEDISKNKEKIEIVLSKEQKNIINHIQIGINNILYFFYINIICSNLMVKYYKITLFYYQLDVLLSKFLDIGNIDEKIYELLIQFLQNYQNIINILFKKKKKVNKSYIQKRNFFFELLLNENFYKNNDISTLLNKLDIIFDILNIILEDNCENNEILQKTIFKKLFKFIFIFNLDENKLEQNENNKKFLHKIQNKCVILLNNFLIKYYNIYDNKNDIIEDYCDKLMDNENKPLIFYYLSYILYDSEIIINIKENFVSYLKDLFIKNYLNFYNNNNNKILTISSLLLLNGYYIINEIEIPEIISVYKNYLKELNIENKIIYFMLQIVRIIMKGSTEINNIINDFKKIKNDKKNNTYDIKKLDKIKEEYLIIFLKLILSLIEEKKGNNNINLEIINGENINLFYKDIKEILFTILQVKNTKLFKIIFSSENNICLDLFYFKLICSDEKEKELIQADLIHCCKELITYHNYPFIFKLIELINENKNNKNKDNGEITKNNDLSISIDKNSNFIEEIETNSKNYSSLVNVVISIINSIVDILKEYKLHLNNKKRNKYYIRGIVNALIIIHNICEMKEKNYYKNNLFRTAFIKLVNLIDDLGLIYSNYCIKIENFRGKLISELIFDSLLYLIISKIDKDISELFFKVFLKENKKKKQYTSIFYLMNLLLINNIEKENKYKKELEIFIDLSKFKKINSLLKTKKKYDLKNSEIFKSLPNYKCIIPLKKVNFCIYFLCKSTIFLYNKLINKDFKDYFSNAFLAILNQNILKYNKKSKNVHNEEIQNKFKLYKRIEDFYINKSFSNLNFQSLKEWLLNVLPLKLKFQYDIKLYYSSLFLFKNNEPNSDNIYNNNNESNRKYSLNISKSFNFNEDLNSSNLNMDEKSKRALSFFDSKIFENNKANEKQNKKIINNINSPDDNIFSINDVANKCFIYNPKNLFIKGIFSHIYYKLIFYDKAFMYIKNIYLRKFSQANFNTKQLNYPSKVKNFSNFYEPKLFLRKDFNFFDDKYFRISHDYLYRNVYNKKEKVDIQKEKKTKSLLNEKISLVNFYKHNFNINKSMLKEKEIFDCELVTSQYVYYGKIFIFHNYIYFETEEYPELFDRNKKIYYHQEKFNDLCFSIRNRDNMTNKHKRIILFTTEIKLIIKRRILLMYQAIEIFCCNGKSFFFNLFKKDECNNFLTILNDIRDSLSDRDKFEIINENIIEKVKSVNSDVKNRIIDNYSYLSKINFYSSRTFNDVGQYPIFPWIILDYEKLDVLLKNVKKEIGKKYDTINPIDKQDQSIGDFDIESKENDIKKSNELLNEECGLRIFNYPLSMQKEEARENSIIKYRDEVHEQGNKKFIFHHGTHYSNSSYVYFFLMRNNPYSQCMIKLQNYAKENPNRLFISFSDTITVFKSIPENRELIPNLFCHFDFFCNLNCDFNGIKSSLNLVVDDIYDNNKNEFKYSDKMFSIYLDNIYLLRKLINSNLVSKFLPKWLDNIFGKNQIPDTNKKKEISCNLFNKYTYEENIQLDKKIIKYQKQLNNKEIDKIKYAEKIMFKIDLINNFGVTPHKVLDNTIKLKTTTDFNYSSSVSLNININIYFLKYNEQILILFNNGKQQNKIKKIASWNYNNIFKDKKNEIKTLYPCGYLKLLEKKSFIDKKNYCFKIPIFKPCYSMSTFSLSNKLFILTCRYLGNIFKVQNNDYYIDVLCEDFVTCIICQENKESIFNNINIMIYTGLKNGKLIEWAIIPIMNDYGKINISEKKDCICHEGEITCIELYERQNIIITGGKDKMIFIRKTYDFELLTVINLLYSYGNPIVSKKLNIVPTMIKVSELNCIYIMLYNYETEKSYIRGYNLNGLFFAQSKENDFMNICFTKNGSLLTSYYNKEKIEILKCNDFESTDFKLKISDFFNNNKKNKSNPTNNFLIWFNYNYKNKEFILLFEDQIIKTSLEDLDKQKDLEYY